MKYEQPYGVSDPNAAYINGNPSTGTMGSIPPAASIENPQREIVNTIADTGLIVPSDADLHQLAKAIQSGQLNFKHDTGVANSYAANMVPSPGPYFEGLSVIMKVGAANTGASVLNLNALGNAPIARSDGSPLLGGEMIPGSYVNLLYDGAKFRMVWAQSVGSGAGPATSGEPVYMTAPRDFYVNATTGDDTYDGTSATHVSGVKGPFKTLQRAAYEYPKYNLNGFSITFHVADGTYAQLSCGPGNGAGAINWIGNAVNPGNVFVSPVYGSAIVVSLPGPGMSFTGFACQSNTGDGRDPGFGVWSVQGANVFLNSMYFYRQVEGAMACSEAVMVLNGPFGVVGAMPYVIGADGGRIGLNAVAPPSLTMYGPVPVSYGFEIVGNVGRIVGPWGAITNFASVTGPKYSASGNGIINTWGFGAGSIPGTLAGAVGSGGQVY